MKVQRPDALSTISKVLSCRSQCPAAIRPLNHVCMAYSCSSLLSFLPDQGLMTTSYKATDSD